MTTVLKTWPGGHARSQHVAGRDVVRGGRAPYVLCSALAGIAALGAGLTVAFPSLLHGAAVSNGNMRGTAAALFAVGLPVLIVAMTGTARGSARAFVVWLGTLGYLIYQAFLLCFATPMNNLFLLYVAYLGLAVWSTVMLLRVTGRTVFVSSHLMSEMSVTADDLIVIGRGRLIANCSTEEFIERSSHKSVLVKSADPTRLRAVLVNAGAQLTAEDDGAVSVRSLDARHIGELASHAGIVLWELRPQLASLEEAFRDLTHDNRDFSAPPTSPDTHPVPVLAVTAAAEATR
jgi:hypothetical protein